MKTTRFLEFGVILATLYLTNEGDWRSPGRDRRCRGRNLERAALSRVCDVYDGAAVLCESTMGIGGRRWDEVFGDGRRWLALELVGGGRRHERI
uniref:Secreted protein n=1 Tax=Lactuca sativa TaxID=4236 RepID=A0A9R1VM78_LACSA|nr:hypothetical protein LSAT_V11C500240400 [Lactuca sativa]